MTSGNCRKARHRFSRPPSGGGSRTRRGRNIGAETATPQDAPRIPLRRRTCFRLVRILEQRIHRFARLISILPASRSLDTGVVEGLSTLSSHVFPSCLSLVARRSGSDSHCLHSTQMDHRFAVPAVPPYRHLRQQSHLAGDQFPASPHTPARRGGPASDEHDPYQGHGAWSTPGYRQASSSQGEMMYYQGTPVPEVSDD